MSRLRTVIVTIAALGAMAGVVGLAVVFLGLFNTSAQKGHWPITSWVLHTTFRNAVELRAPPPSEVPHDLEDAALIKLGARHYDSACRMCHASPGEVATATIAAMVPRPPQVERAVAPWRPEELHWIVEQGVKMSGMPAWPDPHRGDEVWSVVAFLSAVQRGLTDEGYDRLTAAESQGYCAGCHGPQGTSRAPRLDILGPEYIALALAAYRSGERPSGIMSHALSQVDPASDAELAQRLATLPGPGRAPLPPPPAAAEALARGGTSRIPACLACHGPENSNPLIPRLVGQSPEYLQQQLILWRAGQRGGGERAVLMHSAAQGLTDPQIEALAAYFASRDAFPEERP
nr:c-type cytochrome [Paracoccus saliphilus]